MRCNLHHSLFVLFIYRGIGLHFYGYSPKLPQLAADVSKDIGDVAYWNNIDPTVIHISKDRMLRSLKSCKHKTTLGNFFVFNRLWHNTTSVN